MTLAERVLSNVLAAGGRPVPVENFHVTLAFLGAVPDSLLSALVSVARAISVTQPVMALTFDRVEYWKKPKVLCVTASEPSPAVCALAELLVGRLTAAGFAPDLKPFRAHVSLARKVVHAVAPDVLAPVVWSFTSFALVESRTGSQGPEYGVLESFGCATAPL